jgi:hypothetical protein
MVDEVWRVVFGYSDVDDLWSLMIVGCDVDF